MAIKAFNQTTQFNITPIIGVDIGNNYPVYAIPGSSATQTNLYYPETSNPPFALGTHILGTENSEYVLCVVGTAGSINQYDLVMFDANYNVQQSSSAIATNGMMIGFNQNAGIAASQSSVTVNFCWIATRGNTLNVNTNGATGIGTQFYVASTPGTIGSASTASGAMLIRGLSATASVTAATVMAVIAAFPDVGVQGV